MSRIVLAVCLSTIAAFVVACGSGTPTTPPTNAPSRPRPSRPAPTPKTVRVWDAEVQAELVQAFRANPVAAKEQYKDTRFRFPLLVQDFGVFESLFGRLEPAGGEAVVSMRSAREVKKAVRGKVSTVEATVERFSTASKYTQQDILFSDGIIVD